MFTYDLFDFSTFNRAGYSEMYDLCFSQKVSEDYFRWKYESNPAGKVIGFSAAAGQTIAGFYGVIPEHYLINGKPYTFFQSMDTMTHPAFQKKGLFTSLAEKTYQEVLKKDPQSLILGIPGSNSYYGFVNKLNWKTLHHFSFTFIHKFFFKALTIFSGSTYRMEEIRDFFDPNVTSFLNKIIKKVVKIQPSFDSAFFNWRITQHPTISYKSLGFYNGKTMEGAVIYRITENNTCFIDWIETVNEADKKKVLRAFCKYIFQNHPLKFIYTWKPVDKKNASVFNALGFLTNPFTKGPFSYRVPFIIYSNVNEIDGVNINDIQNYYLQPIIQD